MSNDNYFIRRKTVKAAFYTLGCKVNQYESEYMAELLKKAGYEIVSHDEKADYYIVNSCTVTATADQKTRQNIRKFKRNNPDSTVILTGCMPQAYPEEAEKLFEADIVLSNKDNGDILSLINRYNIEKSRIVNINKHENGDLFQECTISHFNERIRAFVKIEDGCDRFCSYCIIPTSRGRVRSKSLEDLKKEVSLLADNGISEIVLVGINLSSYGKGEDFNIVDAVSLCAENPKIKRVRLSSLEPDHITDDVIKGLSRIEKFCPHFHLSLQSGSTEVLRLMNRHYTADDYSLLCSKLRSTFKDCTLTTDVMVGFTGETEELFKESVEFVKKIGFEKVHVFPYSDRPGTAASKRSGKISKEEKKRRSAIMIDETDKIREEYFNSLIGKSVCVLFENMVSKGVYQGYTKNYAPVRVRSEENLIGYEKDVTIKSVNLFSDCCEGILL